MFIKIIGSLMKRVSCESVINSKVEAGCKRLISYILSKV